MSLPDGAEYWWDVKNRRTYTGRLFRHHPNYKCSHIRPETGNTCTTPYIDDINCFECIEQIKNGNVVGLIAGKAPETFYMSKTAAKKHRKQKNMDAAFKEKYGVCPCGRSWRIRKNTHTGQEFLGCANFPTCRNTKSIK